MTKDRQTDRPTNGTKDFPELLKDETYHCEVHFFILFHFVEKTTLVPVVPTTTILPGTKLISTIQNGNFCTSLLSG